MKTWNKLPPEILELIFTNVDGDESNVVDRKRNLFECEMVCRTWKQTAKRVVYSDITLTSEESTEKLITTATAASYQHQPMGSIVKILDLDLSLSLEYCAAYLPKFLKLFPSLEHLKARIPSDDLYQVLEESDRTWEHLESIPEPFFEPSNLYYGALACKYSKSLTRLLCDDAHCLLPPAASPNNSSLLIRQFPKLTHLKLKRFSNNPLETFDSIVESCQMLKSFEFNIRPLRMVIVTGEFNSQQYNEEGIDLDKIVARPAIKGVRGLVVIYNDSTLLYLIRKYPQLNVLDINYRDAVDRKFRIIDSDGRCTFSPTIVSRFISFITKIHSHHIQLQLPVNILHAALDHYGSISSAPNILRSLSISYKAGSHLHYYIPETNDEANAVIQLSNASSILGSNLQVAYSSGDALSLQPHLVLIEKFGVHLDRLSISISSEYIPGRPNISVLALCLDQVFKYCTNLHHLTVYESTFILSIIPNSCITNSSITDLVLQDIVLLNEDVFCNISKSLPSLKNFVLDNCRLENDRWDDPKYNYGGIVDMKATSFDRLTINNPFFLPGRAKFDVFFLKLFTKSRSETSLYQLVYDDETGKQKMLTNDYYTDIKHLNVLNILVKCASIKTIKIDIHPFSTELTV